MLYTENLRKWICLHHNIIVYNMKTESKIC